MNLPAILILVATWFCVLSLQLAIQKKKKTVSNAVSSYNSSKCGIAGLFITLAAVISSVFICNAYNLTTDQNIQQKRSEIRKEIEEFRLDNVIESISKIGISLGIFEDPDSRKLGTKNSISYSEENEVKITLSELPEHSIYLKNYTGSVYEDNSWNIIPEDEWKNNEKFKALFSQFECVPQILPFMSNQSLYGSENNAQIKIQPIDNSSLTLQPYAAYGESCGYVYDYGCAVKNNEEYDFTISLNQNFYKISSLPLNYYYIPSSGFNFNDKTTSIFFNNLEADMNQDSLCISSIKPPYLKNSKYKTQALQASLTESYAYRQFAHEKYASPVFSEPLEEVYSSLPSELINISKSGNDIETLGAIRKYLAQMSEYTTAPGETPSTRDFVNYFLLENNKGYCMHYATAGVILARYFGIPARYCEGYIVSEDMMSKGKKNRDGSVTINIPDSASHAWCEYYIDGYGWVPYELTPGYYENISESENIENTDEMITEPPEQTEIQTETITETETESTTATSESAITTEQPANESEETIVTDNSEQTISEGTGNLFFKILFAAIIIILLVIAVLSIFVISRNYAVNKRNRNFYNSNTAIGILSIYDFLMTLLKYQSICPGNSQLLDFAAEAKEKLSESGFDGNGASFIIKTALAADMGGKIPSNDDVFMSIQYVNSLAEFIGKNKNPFERLIMKYIHHFF
ncbi:MAG: transglutaminase-like domain-containing protein [Oscillospiraceae bacterium]|nr:transglutaminase-like domain-containing protein [Oscillospiraceae bacterium]